MTFYLNYVITHTKNINRFVNKNKKIEIISQISRKFEIKIEDKVKLRITVNLIDTNLHIYTVLHIQKIHCC